MPTSSAELHDKWKSDHVAAAFLVAGGYKLDKGFTWTPPTGVASLEDMSDDDYEAMKYLILEWDWGGLNVA